MATRGETRIEALRKNRRRKVELEENYSLYLNCTVRCPGTTDPPDSSPGPRSYCAFHCRLCLRTLVHTLIRVLISIIKSLILRVSASECKTGNGSMLDYRKKHSSDIPNFKRSIVLGTSTIQRTEC